MEDAVQKLQYIFLTVNPQKITLIYISTRLFQLRNIDFGPQTWFDHILQTHTQLLPSAIDLFNELVLLLFWSKLRNVALEISQY